MNEDVRIIRAESAMVTTERLYRLPDGTWVMPSDIQCICAHHSRGLSDPSGRVFVDLRQGRKVVIRCETYEEACEVRDRIAADVSPPPFAISQGLQS